MSENATETATKPEPVDLSYLAKAKTRKASIAPVPRGRRSAPNPLADHYAESFGALDAEGTGEARSLKVTAGVALRVESLLRKAAFDAKYGITIQMQLDEKGTDIVALTSVKELEPETAVWVAFQAKPKQVQNRAPKAEANGADAPANPAE